MANSKREDLARRLHPGGVRKRAANLIAGANEGRRKQRRKRMVDDLGRALSHAEAHPKDGPHRSEATAKKGRQTSQAQHHGPEPSREQGEAAGLAPAPGLSAQDAGKGRRAIEMKVCNQNAARRVFERADPRITVTCSRTRLASFSTGP